MILLLAALAWAAPDTDGDGIKNKADICPEDPEDYDGHEDWDGCPEGDDDGDGVHDDDLCPAEPEDHDGFEDADGCPDPDNDGDGLIDAADRCPASAEDKDGFEDADGCPDPDNDGDGVPDTADKCMSERETVNGFEDADGCPDILVSQLLFPSAPAPAPAPAPVVAPVVAPAPVSAPVPVAKTLPSIDGRLVGGKRAERDSAVVLGIEDYVFVPDVPYARRDAEAFYNFLLYTRGIPAHRVRHLTTGSNVHLQEAIAEAGRETGPGGTVWVYFAGHGSASPVTTERILLGDDVRADVTSFESRALSVSEIERLARAGGGRAVLVLDTCFAGVGRSGDALAAGSRFAVPSYAARPSDGAATWTAAGPNQLSGPLEGARHGAFTYFAVGALRGWADGELTNVRDGKVTAEEAQAYVARALRAYQIRDQQPVWAGDATWVLSEGVSEVGPTF